MSFAWLWFKIVGLKSMPLTVDLFFHMVMCVFAFREWCVLGGWQG